MAAFARADSLFTLLAREYPESDAGRESLFYLGALRLDPRNPDWDPQPAEMRLRRYLAADSTPSSRIHRRPEAEILVEVAHQLNLPPDERISGLQPEEKVVKVPQRIVSYKQSEAQAGEISDLRQHEAIAYGGRGRPVSNSVAPFARGDGPFAPPERGPLAAAGAVRR